MLPWILPTETDSTVAGDKCMAARHPGGVVLKMGMLFATGQSREKFTSIHVCSLCL